MPLTLVILLVVGAISLGLTAGSVGAIHENQSSSTPTDDGAEHGDRIANESEQELVESVTAIGEGVVGERDKPVRSAAEPTKSLNLSLIDGLAGNRDIEILGDTRVAPMGFDATGISIRTDRGPGGSPEPADDIHPPTDSMDAGSIAWPSAHSPDATGNQPVSGGISLGLSLGGVALAAALRRGVILGTAVSPVAAHPLGRELDRLVRMVAPLRYSRFDDSDPLEHDTRCEVHRVVDDQPGTYLSAVAETVGVPLSTARHHVRVLEREGLIASVKIRGKRRFFPADADEVDQSIPVDDGAAAAVVDALATLGPSSVADLADFLDRDSSTVTYHLQRLADDGLVVRERDGRSVENRLSETVRDSIGPDEKPAPLIRTAGSPADD